MMKDLNKKELVEINGGIDIWQILNNFLFGHEEEDGLGNCLGQG